eukprot:TRINITY_DN33733_c0_g1_i1.p1 TRINITY_DN33733_c0_g1~~TRINITY_DN33733_c0_g1_i1.p1  ORF type:complete len:1022 (+),score=342.59 TRINITY_DN33733_c0_g1_i1:79-3066(+)
MEEADVPQVLEEVTELIGIVSSGDAGDEEGQVLDELAELLRELRQLSQAAHQDWCSQLPERYAMYKMAVEWQPEIAQFAVRERKRGEQRLKEVIARHRQSDDSIGLRQERQELIEQVELLRQLEPRVQELEAENERVVRKYQKYKSNQFHITNYIKDVLHTVSGSVKMQNLRNTDCPIRHVTLGQLVPSASDCILTISPPIVDPTGKRHPVGEYTADLSKADLCNRDGVAESGTPSPASQVTVSASVREFLGIPEQATQAVFLSPLAGAEQCIAGEKGRPKNGTDALFAFGGFAFQDADGNVVGTRAIGDVRIQVGQAAPPPSAHPSLITGPFKWDVSLTVPLWRGSRFHHVRHSQLIRAGVKFWCWISPDEALQVLLPKTEDAALSRVAQTSQLGGLDAAMLDSPLSPDQGSVRQSHRAAEAAAAAGGSSIKRSIVGDGCFVFLFGEGAAPSRELGDFWPRQEVVHKEHGVGIVVGVNVVKRTLTVEFTRPGGEKHQHRYAEAKLRAGRIQPRSQEIQYPEDLRDFPLPDPRDSYFVLVGSTATERLDRRRQELLAKGVDMGHSEEFTEILDAMNQMISAQLLRDAERYVAEEEKAVVAAQEHQEKQEKVVQEEAREAEVTRQVEHTNRMSVIMLEEREGRGAVEGQWGQTVARAHAGVLRAVARQQAHELGSRNAALQRELQHSNRMRATTEEELRELRDRRLRQMEEEARGREAAFRELRSRLAELQEVELRQARSEADAARLACADLQADLQETQREQSKAFCELQKSRLESDAYRESVKQVSKAFQRRCDNLAAGMHYCARKQSDACRGMDDWRKRCSANEGELRELSRRLREAENRAADESRENAKRAHEAETAAQVSEGQIMELKRRLADSEAACRAAELRAAELERSSGEWRSRWREMSQELRADMERQLARQAEAHGHAAQREKVRLAQMEKQLSDCKATISELQGQLAGYGRLSASPQRMASSLRSPPGGSPTRLGSRCASWGDR